jgi:Nif-specific regulatory protein
MDGDPQQLFLGMPAVVASEAMSRVIDTARRAARTNVAVLITGETGSGKEIVARAIHHYSLRCTRPWVDINCGALPEQLMESELFGHEKGAFSGADSAKAGLFEMAHSGSLFLDEIGELDPRMQVKMLRVLDGVPYYRVGGLKKVSADVRIIAATNQDLLNSVRAGRFRADLYHRLNQYHIRVPPLRERVDDIVPLAEYFLRQHTGNASLSLPAQAELRRYHWPGNVRELRNAIAHAAIAARDYCIGAEDLPPLEAAAATSLQEDSDLRLDEMEREAIYQALSKARGHHQKAADLLGISRRTLSRKLKTYRLEAAEESAYPA